MASPTPVRPAFNKRTVAPDSQSAREADLQKVRFLFSPLLYIDTRYDQAGFQSIEPGVITVVDTYRMQIPNTKRIQEGIDSSEPEMVMHERKPGIIANRILSNNREDDGVPTGLCELVELAGLNPNRSREDEQLIADLQATLWPMNYATGQEQLLALMSCDLTGKPEVYARTQARMIEAVENAIAYCDARYVELVDELSQRAAGGEGAKGRRSKVDAMGHRLCAYVDREVPVIASPLVQNRAKEIQAVQAKVAETPALAQVQCEACGAMANRIVATGRPPKMCANCSNPFETPVEPAAIAEQPLTAVTDVPPKPKSSK